MKQKLHFFIHSLVEVQCLPLTSINHGTIEQPPSSSYNDIATVQCQQGNRILEGSTGLILQCMLDSHWNYSVSTLSCAGMKLYVTTHIILSLYQSQKYNKPCSVTTLFDTLVRQGNLQDNIGCTHYCPTSLHDPWHIPAHTLMAGFNQ